MLNLPRSRLPPPLPEPVPSCSLPDGFSGVCLGLPANLWSTRILKAKTLTRGSVLGWGCSHCPRLSTCVLSTPSPSVPATNRQAQPGRKQQGPLCPGQVFERPLRRRGRLNCLTPSLFLHPLRLAPKPALDAGAPPCALGLHALPPRRGPKLSPCLEERLLAGERLSQRLQAGWRAPLSR